MPVHGYYPNESAAKMRVIVMMITYTTALMILLLNSWAVSASDVHSLIKNQHDGVDSYTVSSPNVILYVPINEDVFIRGFALGADRASSWTSGDWKVNLSVFSVYDAISTAPIKIYYQGDYTGVQTYDYGLKDGLVWNNMSSSPMNFYVTRGTLLAFQVRCVNSGFAWWYNSAESGDYRMTSPEERGTYYDPNFAVEYVPYFPENTVLLKSDDFDEHLSAHSPAATATLDARDGSTGITSHILSETGYGASLPAIVLPSLHGFMMHANLIGMLNPEYDTSSNLEIKSLSLDELRTITNRISLPYASLDADKPSLDELRAIKGGLSYSFLDASRISTYLKLGLILAFMMSLIGLSTCKTHDSRYTPINPDDPYASYYVHKTNYGR